jgi:hypothetical protein
MGVPFLLTIGSPCAILGVTQEEVAVNTLIFPVKQTETHVVLSGTGPALHVSTASPARILVVSKSKTQPVTLNGLTNIKFAA